VKADFGFSEWKLILDQTPLMRDYCVANVGQYQKIGRERPQMDYCQVISCLLPQMRDYCVGQVEQYQRAENNRGNFLETVATEATFWLLQWPKCDN
jgi:hypothetical protein